MNNVIKIVLAILFFLCLVNMPYGFYQFVRFAGLIGFIILANQAVLTANNILVNNFYKTWLTENE